MAETKKKKKKGKKKKIGGKVLAAGLVAGVLLAAGAAKVWTWLSDNRLPNFRKNAVIYVKPETTADEVYASLINEAGVKRPYSLNHAFKNKKVAENLTPGRYEIRKGYTSVYVARMLNNGWQSPAKLTLSGTMRQNKDLASKISRQLMIDSLDVIKALENKSMLSAYGFTPRNVFSLFIPDTYEMYWTATMKDVLDKQKEAYDSFWTAERVEKAKAQGLTKEQVSILASIVKGETNYEAEMPKIAGVYLNRLHKGMKLQADPTIAYCLDYSVNRILLKHLEIDSPYNTYKHEGLPPGPIAVPTKACLEAVLNPEGDYLYFCASPTFDGSHRFSKDLSGHNKNANAFRNELNRRAAERKKAKKNK